MVNPEILSSIQKSVKIAILSHVMPDGDSIGSSLALLSTLKQMGKESKFILDDPVPPIYQFLKGADAVESSQSLEDFDLVIALDCGDIERLGTCRDDISGKTIINIDHHPSNTLFGTYNWIDKDAAATAELIYELLQALETPIDEAIAECLYVGLSTDTGHFQYSNTVPKTFTIAGELLTYGVKASEVYEKLYKNTTKEKIQLIRKALENLEFYCGDRIASIYLTQEQMQEIGVKEGDSDGLINFPRDIDTVEAAVLFKETEKGIIKVGFRSKRVLDVCQIAQHFGGGGHVKASGCTMKGDMESAKKTVMSYMIKAYKEASDRDGDTP